MFRLAAASSCSLFWSRYRRFEESSAIFRLLASFFWRSVSSRRSAARRSAAAWKRSTLARRRTANSSFPPSAASLPHSPRSFFFSRKLTPSTLTSAVLASSSISPYKSHTYR